MLTLCNLSPLEKQLQLVRHNRLAVLSILLDVEKYYSTCVGVEWVKINTNSGRAVSVAFDSSLPARFRHVQTAISPGRERQRNRNGVDCTRRFDALSSNEPSYQVRRRVCFPGEQNCSRCVIYGASNYC